MHIFLPNHTIVGDEGRAPDCVVLMANPMGGTGPTVQRTLARGSDNGWAFWTRIMEESRELLRPMGRYAMVVVFCKYGVSAEHALTQKDSYENYQRVLQRIMTSDPSHRVRVKAACQFAHLLGMDRGTLQ